MSNTILEELLCDLFDENESLDKVTSELAPEQWATPTPAAGWDIRDSISHLCFFDTAAHLALTDPGAFTEFRARLYEDMARAEEPPGGDAPDVALGRAIKDPTELLALWRQTRTAYLDAARTEAAKATPARVEWFGPAMSLASFTTARLLEAWAHGVDVRDALGIQIQPSRRLRHVCHIGINARAFSFSVHGVEDPGDPVWIEVAAPEGEIWEWGPHNAPNRITGTALDLALVLSQRRQYSRTSVRATGPVAIQWLKIAQAFAGPPTVTDTDR